MKVYIYFTANTCIATRIYIKFTIQYRQYNITYYYMYFTWTCNTYFLIMVVSFGVEVGGGWGPLLAPSSLSSPTAFSSSSSSNSNNSSSPSLSPSSNDSFVGVAFDNLFLLDWRVCGVEICGCWSCCSPTNSKKHNDLSDLHFWNCS